MAHSSPTLRFAVLLLCSASAACSGSEPDEMSTLATAGTSAGSAGANAGTTAGASGSGTSGTVGSDSDDDAGAGVVTTPDGGPETQRDGGAVVGSGPGDWTAGDYPSDVRGQTYLEISGVSGQNNLVRQYKVHVPPSYEPNVPMPLVFCFHGLAQNPVMFCMDGAGMLEKSDGEGFILVMPYGHQNSWNGGTCCGGAADAQLDDVALVRAIFDEVKGHVNVDLARVYATGLSNGGYLSYRLACEASDIFAAIAPGAGVMGMDDIGGGTRLDGNFEACEPEHPVSVLHMHGTADGLVAYAHMKPSLDRIAAANGCKSTTKPATAPKSTGDTSCVSYEGCPSGVDVTGCTVMNGGHVWFGDPSCGTGAGAVGCGFVGANSTALVNTDAAWSFFAAHAR